MSLTLNDVVIWCFHLLTTNFYFSSLPVVTNDGGCSTVPFDDVQELNVDVESLQFNEDPIDHLYHQMFDLSWFKGIESKHARTKIWLKYCDTLVKNKWYLDPTRLKLFGDGIAKKNVDKSAACTMLGKLLEFLYSYF